MKRSSVTGVLFFLGTIGILVVAFVLQVSLLGRWLAILLLMAGTLIAIGVGVAGRWWSVLIDERNKFSLSRLQLVLWTMVVLSAFLVVVVARLLANDSDPMAVAVPETLWWLMGISTASLVGSPLIRATKTDKGALPSERDETARQLGSKSPADSRTTSAPPRGLIVQNATTEGARWTDLFMGEETGNAAQPDMGKVQMFYFTVIIVMAYVVTLVHTFNAATTPDQLPPVPESMLALLTISHAGYLINKGVPHSRVAA